jgi:hypothetical protein
MAEQDSMTRQSKGYLANPDLHRIGKIHPDQLLHVLNYAMPLMVEECPPCSGTGIVMVAGGKYLRWAHASIRKAREVTDLPIQIWHLGEAEVTPEDREKFADLDVEFVNARDFQEEHPTFQKGGWETKSYAVAYCPFERVLMLDADCYPLVDPELLFETPEFKSTGVIMWPDLFKCRKDDMIFPCMGLRYDPNFQEMEVGQLVINKKQLWRAVYLTTWMNSHSECFYKLGFGDKDQWQMALRKIVLPFTVGEKATWMEWGMRHNWDGEAVFCHAMNLKRGSIPGPADYMELLGQYELMNLQAV